MNGIMMKRRHFLALSAVTLAGCAGRQRSTERHTYTESIHGVFLTEDERQLVVAGRDYHYFFAADPQLIASLRADFHSYLTVSIQSFRIKDNEQAYSSFALKLPEDAPPQAIEQAVTAGYQQKPGQGYVRYFLLQGRRYDAGGVDASLLRLPQQDAYQVTVVVEQSAEHDAASLLMTPVTVLGKGVFALVAIPLGIILFPFMLGTVLLVCSSTSGACFGGGSR